MVLPLRIEQCEVRLLRSYSVREVTCLLQRAMPWI